MDGARFDRIAKSLATPATRRGALALPAALGLGRLLAAGPAAAKQKPKKKKGCGKGEKPCGKKCIPKKNCCVNSDCDRITFESCVNGRCRCLPNEILHNGVCGEFPTCGHVGKICTDHNECCSYNCGIVSDDGLQRRCNRGAWACYADVDCHPGLTCRGFMCRDW